MPKDRSAKSEPVQPVAAFLDRVRLWAVSRPDIAIVLLVGSWARGQAGPESDVDLVILADAPQRLLGDRDWLGALGEVRTIREEDWGRVRSLRVVYRSGPEVEYGIAGPDWLAQPLDVGTQRVLMDGARIIYQRDSDFGPVLRVYISTHGDQAPSFSVSAIRDGSAANGPPAPDGRRPTDGLGRSLVLVGAGLCLLLTLGIWRVADQVQPTWPLPGVYFIELVALVVLCAGLWIGNHRSAEAAAWIAFGIILAFAWMARLSIGLLYIPVVLAFGAGAFSSTARRRGGIWSRLGIALLAGLLQTGLILLLA